VGKPTAEFDGRMYVQERWLKADVAIIKAELADRQGNLTYRKAGRNFSPLMAAAADLTIVQARHIVEPGGIEPEQVVTPGLFVDRIVEVADAQQEEALMRAGVAYS
jgi:3-oxoadipate CoA-transferase alpha subunit